MSFLVKAYAGQLDRGTEVGTLGPCEANSGDKVSISTIVTSLLLQCDFLGLLAQKCPTLLPVFPKIKPTKKQTNKKRQEKKPPQLLLRRHSYIKEHTGIKAASCCWQQWGSVRETCLNKCSTQEHLKNNFSLQWKWGGVSCTACQ